MISGRIYHPIYDLHSHVVNLNLRPRSNLLLPRYEPERLRVCYNAPKSAYRGRID